MTVENKTESLTQKTIFTVLEYLVLQQFKCGNH